MGDGRKAIEGKINEVYANGPDQENLINNIANMIYKLYKLPVDDYVTIDMNAFKTMLNNMGGIEMYVPGTSSTVDKNTGKEDVVAKKGTHLISGDTAELILRNRNYATADYQRLETQQYFYAALVKTFLEDYTLADYYTTCKVIAHYINTSLDITDIWGLYGTMLKVQPENIYIVRAPGGAAHINGHTWVYYTDRENCARILNEHFRSPDKPVAAEDLGLATGYEYIAGSNVDEGRTMGSVMDAAQEGQQSWTPPRRRPLPPLRRTEPKTERAGPQKARGPALFCRMRPAAGGARRSNARPGRKKAKQKTRRNPAGLCFRLEKSGVGLVRTLRHAADLAGGGVLVDHAFALRLGDGGNSHLDNGVLVSGIRGDGSVCLLDDCFQVDLIALL